MSSIICLFINQSKPIYSFAISFSSSNVIQIDYKLSSTLNTPNFILFDFTHYFYPTQKTSFTHHFSLYIYNKQESSMQIFSDGPSPFVTTNISFLAFSSFIIVTLIILLCIYRLALKQAPPIVPILALLLLNYIFELVCQLPAYFSNIPNSVCVVSIIGTTFFRLASYYWLIFITRLLYRLKATPGKYIDLRKYIGKYIIFTYIPSIAVTLVVLIAANIDDTSSQNSCWRLIKEKSVTDYIVYLSSFVLPNLIALTLILLFLVKYFRTPAKNAHNLLLGFPLLGVLSISYQMVLRMMIFFGEWIVSDVLQLPFLLEPLSHGIFFILVLINAFRGKRITASDLTIQAPQQKSADNYLLPADQK